MARKTLLNESEIRRFMKLANVKPVGQERLEEMYGMPPGARDEDDESVQDEDPAGKSLEEQEEEVEMDMAAEEEPMDMDKPAEEPMDEPEMDMDMGAGAGVQINLDDFLSALESALENVTGEEVSTDMDMEADEGGDDEAADMEMDMDMDAPEGDMEMDMSMDDEEPGMRDMMEARVNRIAARVAQRLMAENKKASNIDALTERIFNRLANK
jgi:hypothetical protein